MSNWSLAASLPTIFLGLIVWVIAIGLSVAHIRRSRGARHVILLESLRFLIVTALVVTLLRPEYVRVLQRTSTPEVAILYDRSGSMTTRDMVVGSNIISRNDWLAGKTTNEFWSPLEGKGKVLHLDVSPSNATNVNVVGTDLGTPLEHLLQRQDRLKAVLMLTDGDWNFGPNPIGAATRLREQGIPVFAVPVGREKPLPDLALEKVTPPSYGLFGEQISIPFKLRSTLPQATKVDLILTAANREETRKTVTIPAQGELNDAILWSPRAVGEVELNLAFATQPGETLPENNSRNFKIDVRVEKLQVLVIDSLPRWEYRYLRNALERDPGVEMHALLYHPGIGLGGGRNYLAGFPASKELISRYDVIFLGDVGLGDGELKVEEAELIRGLIEQQSSGLVFLPGRRGRQLTFVDSPLKDLLPVNFDTNRANGVFVQNEGNLLLTSSGKGHLLTRFDADEGRNDQIWKQLPGLFWSAAVEKNRPGSEVIGVHSGLRTETGRMPLLATRNYGSGKVLFMGSDSAWRWRRGVEDKYHYRFWSQVVRWMAHQRHMAAQQGIRLTYSPEVPQVNDPLFLQATVLDARGFPLEEKIVLGKITSPSGRTEGLEFNVLEGGWGVFKTEFTPREHGPYKITIGQEDDPRRLNTEIPVTRPVLEKEGQPINVSILREVAEITKGAIAAPEKLEDLIQAMTLLPEPKPMERRVRLWSHPAWGGALLALLAIYWTGRKLAGMV